MEASELLAPNLEVSLAVKALCRRVLMAIMQSAKVQEAEALKVAGGSTGVASSPQEVNSAQDTSSTLMLSQLLATQVLPPPPVPVPVVDVQKLLVEASLSSLPSVALAEAKLFADLQAHTVSAKKAERRPFMYVDLTQKICFRSG